MKLDDLNILVQEGEGTTLEFKERFSRSISREIVALANTIGGKILLGVSDDCLLYTSPSPRDRTRSRMPSSA